MAKTRTPGARITAKKRCCKDGPRCKKCPVVLKRLAADGFLERIDRRSYRVIEIVPKSTLTSARRRAK
ncbi:hypothetical protein [Paraconexibacter sp.]|uniref:hypothetical protein n=1 Tax=Paraconexibacter sp. TaxID=2949640 RepID=UPI003565FFB4